MTSSILRPLRARASAGLVALLLLAGLVLAVAMAQAWAIRIARGDVPGDTLGYYTGAWLVARGQGQRLYDPSAVVTAQAALLATLPEHNLQRWREPKLLFLNPPFVAALFVPLALLPLEQAYLVWGLANWLLALALGALCAAASSTRALWQRGLWFLGVLTFNPVYETLLIGQASLALAVAALGGWMLIRRKHGLLGGLVLAGLLIKPQYAALVLLGLFLGRRWRAIGGFGVGAAGASLLALLAVGSDGMLNYLRFLPQMGGLWPEYGWNPAADQTWHGLAVRLLGQGMPADLLWAGLSAVTLGLVATMWRPWRRADATPGPLALEDTRFAAMFLAAVLMSPHAFVYDLALLVPVGVIGWTGLREARGPQWFAATWVGIEIVAWSSLVVLGGTGKWWYGPVLAAPLMGASLALLVVAAARPQTRRVDETPTEPSHSLRNPGHPGWGVPET